MRDEITSYRLALQVHQDHAVPVFPVKLSREDTGKWQKAPLVKWGRLTSDTQPGEVNWRNANAVGVPMGQRSGLLAIDLDTYKDGSEANAWVETHKLPVTRTHRTASGGRHLIFRLPAGMNFGNQAPKVAGLDIRGNGGFIVWADTGGRYSVEVDMAPVLLPASVCDDLAALQPVSGPSLTDADLPRFEYVDRQALESRLSCELEDPLRPDLGRRFDGSVKGLSDKSASGRDMSVAALLARRGFSYAEIVTVLLEYFLHGTAARDGWTNVSERAAKRCAARAIRQVEDRDQHRLARLAELLGDRLLEGRDHRAEQMSGDNS